jgi:isocitrate/isopropylmalate dehydrogenase
VDGQTIVVLDGDQTGQELLDEALRVLAPDVTGIPFEFPRFDLSLESRRATQNQVVFEAARAVRAAGLGLKAATVTPEGAGDVGSPNRILREEIGGKVIVRTGRRIPGVVPMGGVHAPISIVRMAVGDAYGAKEWREGEGDDEVALRTERIERRICHAVAEFAFRQAARTGAKVFGGPKYTVSPIYEGMLKEEMDAAAARHPDVPYEPQLIDATFALLIGSTGDPLVIPSLNRDGDILSDLVLPLFGSIAGSESLLVAFAEDFQPDALMAEAAHGTAPSLEGKNVAEPDGDDPGRGCAANAHGRAGTRGRARDPRVLLRGGVAGRANGRSGRALLDDRVHGRGHLARPLEAGRLVEPLILLADDALAQVVHAEEEQDADGDSNAGADQPPLLDGVSSRVPR